MADKNSRPTLQDVYQARQRIAQVVRRTPLHPCSTLSELTGSAVQLKLENLQRTNSFKLRGAANKLHSLSAEEKARGVVTVSTGNHGRAMAYAGRKLGIRPVVCLSENVPDNKVEGIRRLGAEVVQAGQSYDESVEHALRLQREQGLTMIEPFDDPQIIAGQGTVGLEILEDWPEIDTAVIPLSGGGLAAGIALALKSANPAIRTIGISMQRAPVMYHSLKAGQVIEMEELPTLADALAGGIGLDNRYTYPMVRDLIDETYLVSEGEIAAGMVFAFQQHKLVIEGGAAVGISALLYGRAPKLGANTVLVISGGNVDTKKLLQLVEKAYQKDLKNSTD